LRFIHANHSARNIVAGRVSKFRFGLEGIDLITAPGKNAVKVLNQIAIFGLVPFAVRLR